MYWFYHFTVVLVLTNSCVNPLIYAAKYREFQLGVRRLASCFTRQLTQTQSSDGTSSVRRLVACIRRESLPLQQLGSTRAHQTNQQRQQTTVNI